MSIKAPHADLNQGSQRTGQVSSRAAAGAPAGQVPGTNASASDTVTLTSAAASLLKLEESLAKMPELDSERIATLRAAIADGSYQIDPGKIVDRLLNVERDMV